MVNSDVHAKTRLTKSPFILIVRERADIRLQYSVYGLPMRKLTIRDLPLRSRHILAGVIPGDYICQGGLNFKAGGDRSHDVGCACKSCDGKGRHVHEDDNEIFIILQGKARIEVDGEAHDLCAGDVVICEPGEDHHLVSDEDDPCINLYLHTGDEPNAKQKAQ